MLADIEIPVIASRWLHIAAAMIAVGGTFFLRVVLMPAARTGLSAEAHEGLRPILLRRWSSVLHACIGLLLFSGIYNMVVQLPRHRAQPVYHSLLGMKIILALGLFFIATAIVGSNPAFERLRKNRAAWMMVNLILAALIVLLSNVLKNLPVA